MQEETKRPVRQVKKKEDTELVTVLGELTSFVKKIDERISKLESSTTDVLTQSKPETVERVQTPFVPTISEAPIPVGYRVIVEQVLNKFFGIRILPRSDAPLFEFVLVCPDKYSRATPEQKKMIGGEDIRPKVLDYAQGENGVRQWAETVFNSFSAEIKAQIVADRLAS